MQESQVILTKRQFRQLCNAYINITNLFPQLLMITPRRDKLSTGALHCLEDGLQQIKKQLKEVIDGEANVLPSKRAS